ncbi:MAG: sugar phosphate isomerase/epimerase family protein [Lachnospiraceae bacterium]
MRLSTSTNIVFNRPDGHKATIQESIRLCSAAGYRVMDMNFHDCTTFKLPFVTDNWREWLDDVKATADDCGIEFSQCHSSFFNFCDPYAPNKEFMNKMVYRSMEAAGLLGVKWAVIHAGTDFNSARSVYDSKKKNIEYFKPLIEYAGQHNVGVAIENLWDLNISPLRRYTTTSEELVELVDELSLLYPNVGICWDCEHADIMKQDQTACLELIGSRLKATHISDNTGINNDHILPFNGTTDWYEIMGALKRIGYNGDFTYEAHQSTNRLPDELLLPLLKYSVEVGNFLLSLK